MSASDQIERRISQQGNDIVELYGMVEDIQKTVHRHDRQLKEIAERLNAVDGKLDELLRRLPS